MNDVITTKPTEPTEDEMYDQWLNELGEIAGDIMDAMLNTCAEKLTKQGMTPSDVSYVEETLFSNAVSDQIWETIWEALMRI
jgi:hypothetical protein